MKIKNIRIQQFGKLKQWEAEVSDGLTIIYGPNESGKSTLHSFLRAMIFGLPRYRGRAAKTDPYTHYEPWENPFSYGGSMAFEVGGKEFLLERSFYKNDIREHLSCVTDGEELSVADGDLEMLLGNISESIYDNTVSVSQLGSGTDEGMIRELQQYMANLEDTGSGAVDMARAREILRKKRKVWEEKERICLQKEEERRLVLERQCSYVEQERKKWDAEVREIRRKKEQIQQEIRTMEQEGMRNIRNIKQSGTGRTKMVMLFGFLLLLVSFLLHMVSAPLPEWLSMAGIAAGAVMLMVAILQTVRENSSGRETLVKELDRWKGHQEIMESQVQEKETEWSNLQEELEEAALPSEEAKSCRTEIESLDLALRTLEELSGQMRLRIGERLKVRTGEILSEITGGKYSHLSMDEDMKIRIRKDNRQIPLYQLSRGTIEQIYFSLRMAVSEILCEEPMPLLLDDVFAMYDEERLSQTLAWLANRKGQTLLFTCHRREAQLAERMGLSVHRMEMQH